MTVKAVVEACGESFRGSKVYLRDRLPSELLANAVESFGQSLDPSDICLLADGSESGFGGEGLLISTVYVAFRNRSREPTRMQLADIRSVEAKHGKFMSAIVLNGTMRIELWGFKQPWITGLERAIKAAADASHRTDDIAAPVVQSSITRVAVSEGDSVRKVSPTLTAEDEVRAFLKRVGLEYLQPAFAEHNITYELLRELSDADLAEIGVKALGDRRLIRAELQKTSNEELDVIATAKAKGQAEAGKKASSMFWLIAIVAGIVMYVVYAADKKSGGDLAIPFGIGAFFAAMIYLLPAHIAFSKQSEYRWAIFAGNLFFGATVIGWVILLFWSLSLINAQTAAVLGTTAAISKRL
jgi:hypothetical protein